MTTKMNNTKKRKGKDLEERTVWSTCTNVNAGYLLRALPFSLLEEHQIPRRMQ